MHAGRWFPLGAALAAAVTLAGCSSGGSTAPQARGSISDAAAKLSVIMQDECETRPAADVYARCARFTAELSNVASAAAAAATGRPGGPAAQDAAATLSTALATFTRDGCLGPTPAQQCPTDHSTIQSAVRALAGAVAKVPPD